MDTNLVFMIALVVIVVILLIFTLIIGYNKVKPIDFTNREIPKFSVDVKFNEYPQVIAVENQFDCNVKTLRKCKLDDVSTLFGCRELTVRCQHFSTDTEFIDGNGHSTIPSNTTPNDGYALAITAIADSCNPYHGDLTLAALDHNSTEYMLICTCKNPGYIGNENILGNCTTAYICDGKIDNIDQPLNEIVCECDQTQKNIRYDDGLPVCKSLIVREANEQYTDWTYLIPWNSDRHINANVYNVTISSNLNTKQLLDPCRNAATDTSLEIPFAKYNTRIGSCQVNDFGYPISNKTLNFAPKYDELTSTEADAAPPGPNGHTPIISADAVLPTSEYEYLRFTDNCAGVRRIMAVKVPGIQFYSGYEKTPLILHMPDGLGLGTLAQVYITTDKTEFIGPRCENHWPSYTCYLNNYIVNETANGLTLSDYRTIPITFLFNTDSWADAETLVIKSYSPFPRNGAELRQTRFQKFATISALGIQYAKKSSPEPSGILSFRSQGDFIVHKRTMT